LKRDAASEAHADSFDENGMAIEGTSKMIDESMSSGAENETQDEDDDSSILFEVPSSAIPFSSKLSA